MFNQIKTKKDSAMVTSFIDLSSYSESMEAMADEAQAHLDLAKANGAVDGDMSVYCNSIQKDVGSWKKMKVKFEEERIVLALLRDDVMALFTQRTEQLENLEAAHHDVNKVPASVAEEEEAEEAGASASPAAKKKAHRFEVIPYLEAHLESTIEKCTVAEMEEGEADVEDAVAAAPATAPVVAPAAAPATAPAAAPATAPAAAPAAAPATAPAKAQLPELAPTRPAVHKGGLGGVAQR